MAILIVCRGIDPKRYELKFAELAPDLEVRCWPEHGPKADIRYALVWDPPPGELKTYPNLQVIFSSGAGVEHILSDPDLPALPIVRLVEPNLTMRMTEYVVLHVLLHHRRILDYQNQQRDRRWRELAQPGADEVRVGVLGLGVLGLDAAEKLAALKFQVAGWSRTPKKLAGIAHFSGRDGLTAFLARSEILVALLPLTGETTGIIDRALLAKLPKDGPLPGPVLINPGRGGLHVEADILSALEEGDLWAASLDVFEPEPLPEASPLWRHPRVVVTPHNASISDERAVIRHVLRQIAAHEAGEALQHLVDRTQGY
jgi:glyoxylate/hydroxypyruvate reductase A